MKKLELTTKENVFLLVSSFYDKIRKDETLGPIFNGIITDWDHHLQHLTNFWSNQLFIERGTYKGNPIAVHNKVDNYTNNTINEMHFGIWLNYWLETLDELFEGDNVNIAKNRARNMGSNIHIHIFNARQNTSS
ncbi:group III truncated hemoglobin [Cellulophaga lytica]|uniref:Sec-independent protein translocase TatC n=1 Tax=Cellulophaga geojensis KL-A TaxID=1328323 RepID=A0ABN0RNA0_9FLAO|nr:MULTISPECIES: group III truncated hemoglobin [Cellulophaga]EWH13421.1 sec-independent protein translocase TatC [Cellulophaga geojensis KL-A]TVZ09709.1 hemoglobin [Cellulophaga sp. RHA_52]SNQ44305.1 Globin-like protein [Cellulophaga lytica]